MMKNLNSNKKKRSSTTIYSIFGGLFVVFLLLFVMDLAWGNSKISFVQIIRILFGNREDLITSEIILNFRLPKAITAILAGSALSVSGLMMQTFFRNPLADPYVLGVSSGASLGVAIVMMATGFLLGSSSWIVVLAAIIGAVLVMMLIVGVSFKVQNAVSLLIVGLMLGTIVASIVGVLQYFSNPDAIKLFVMWNLGSLSAVSWQHLSVLAPLIFVALIGAFFLHHRLDGMLLGENYARSLGISIVQSRFLIIIVTSVLAGSITAFAGPIGFVGIAIPHIARGLFRTASHKILIPGSFLLGSMLLLLCDIVSQLPTYTLPINTISSLFGAPIIIWIILKKR
jgi:iron complex transport system permease protein